MTRKSMTAGKLSRDSGISARARRHDHKIRSVRQAEEQVAGFDAG